MRCSDHRCSGCWLAGLLLAAVTAASEWPALTAHAAQHLFSTAGLATAWLLYPLIKALHEGRMRWPCGAGAARCTKSASACCSWCPRPTSMLRPLPLSRTAGSARWSARPASWSSWRWRRWRWCVWLATPAGLGPRRWRSCVMVIGVVHAAVQRQPAAALRRLLRAVRPARRAQPRARAATPSGATAASLVLRERTERRPPRPASASGWSAYAPLSSAYRLALSVTLVIVLWLGGQWLLLGALLARSMSRWPCCCDAAASMVAPGDADRCRPVRDQARRAPAPAAGWPWRARGAAVAGCRCRTRTRRAGRGVAARAGAGACRRSTASSPSCRWPTARGRAGRPAGRARQPRTRCRPRAAREPARRPARRALPAAAARPDAAQNLALDIERTQAELARAGRAHRAARGARAGGRHAGDAQARPTCSAATAAAAPLGHVLAADALRVRAAVPEHDAHLVRHRLHRAEVRLADAPDARAARHV